MNQSILGGTRKMLNFYIVYRSGLFNVHLKLIIPCRFKVLFLSFADGSFLEPKMSADPGSVLRRNHTLTFVVFENNGRLLVVRYRTAIVCFHSIKCKSFVQLALYLY